MGHIKIPKDWHPDWLTKRRKPTVPVDLDTDNPLTRGIEAVFYSGADTINIRRPRNPILHSDWQGTRLSEMLANYADIGGVGFHTSAASDISYNDSNEGGMLAKADGSEMDTYTLMGVFTTTNAAINQFHGFIGGHPDGNSTDTNHGISRTGLGLAITDASYPPEYYNANITDLEADRLYVTGWDVNNSALEDIWLNGELDDTYSGAQSANCNLRWVNFGINDGHNAGIGTRYMAVVWNRKLTRAEHKSFSDNPYQILKPATPVIMNVPAPSGGGSTITGSGTPQAQAASVSGSGEREVTGSGSPAAQDSTVAGTGLRVITGSGTPAAQDASVSGTGLRVITGSGAPQSQDASVTGSGDVSGSVTGSGSPAAQSSTVSGTGLRVITGSGNPQSQDASVSGSGTPVVTGSGAPAAQESTVAGTGLRVITGAGTPQSQDASVSGSAEREVTGSGAPASQDATVAGAGLRVIIGSGAIQAGSATVVGATGAGPTDVDDLRVERADYLTVESDTDRLTVERADYLTVESA